MEKVAIITDSCSDIKKEYRELYDIHILPIQIQYDGKCYRDGIDITSKDIYAIQDEKLIKTSFQLALKHFKNKHFVICCLPLVIECKAVMSFPIAIGDLEFLVKT